MVQARVRVFQDALGLEDNAQSTEISKRGNTVGEMDMRHNRKEIVGGRRKLRKRGDRKLVMKA